MPTDKFLTTAQAASKLGVTTTNLAAMRCRGTGPAFYKKGRSVLYDARDLAVWQQKRQLVRHDR